MIRRTQPKAEALRAPVSSIEWIEAVGNYARLHVGGRPQLVRSTMTELESRLDPEHFVRIHRSTIVAIDRIRSVGVALNGEWQIVVASGAALAVSRSHADRVRALLQ